MFQSARLKLTGWYLLIIMVISALFSTVIYMGTIGELERGFRRAELRLRAEELDISLPRRFSDRPEDLPLRLREISPRFFSAEDLETAKRKLALDLLMVNSAILVVSAVAGYFLAGKTLKPIETAMEEQRRFVADASHELRTPLAALKTSVEVALRDKKMSLSEARKVMKGSLEDVGGLESLTNNLLNLVNLQSNGRSLFFNDVDVAEVIKKTYQKILPLAKKKAIDIRIEVKKETIKGNRESLEEMMLIFLDNAVKYTPSKGKIAVKTERVKKYLVLKISDTGIGIPPKDLPYIFERFYRVDRSRSKENVSGYGLGLSLAKRIIEIHKGSIDVSSTLAKGTTFTIKLPLGHS